MAATERQLAPLAARTVLPYVYQTVSGSHVTGALQGILISMEPDLIALQIEGATIYTLNPISATTLDVLRLEPVS